MVLWKGANALVEQWFASKFAAPTDVQSGAWEAISADRDVLITAPTGSGKTLAAFLYYLDRLLTGQSGRVLYISPLKALNADMYRNLLEPLAQLRALDTQGSFRELRVGLRSGDSTSTERERLLRNPPEILVTTPESLHILLTSARGRASLAGFTTLILDEIHVLAGSKRGSLAALSVERLAALNPGIRRVGISATLEPLELAAEYLGGWGTDGAKPVRIVRSKMRKTYDLQITLGPATETSWWERQIPVVAELIQKQRTTLMFCNSRRGAEKLAHKLNEHFGEQVVFAHHGSLSREYRSWVENELKEGRLRAVAATGTLELGIDVGAVDQVLMIQSPFSASSAIQRAGRAGHQVGQTSLTRFVPLHPRDILSALAIIPMIQNGESEGFRIPDKPLDVLAQAVLSEAAGRRVNARDFFELARASRPYRDLTLQDFVGVLSMLAGRYEHTRVAELRPRLSLGPVDRQTGMPEWFEGPESLALLIYSSGGTIPDRGYYDLRVDGSLDKIGELDEEFVFERVVGDKFTLGNRLWQILEMSNQNVVVRPAQGGGLIVPFWKADAVGTDGFMAERILGIMESLNRDPQGSEFAGLLGPEVRTALEGYVRAFRDEAGVDFPHRNHLVIEELIDPSFTPDMAHLILHSFWGGKTNAALCLLLRQLYRESRGRSTPGLFTDDAVVLSYPISDAGWDPLEFLRPFGIRKTLEKILPGTGIFGTRFRENAGRALLVLRRGFGKRTPLWVHRMKSKGLLERVLDIDDFPITAETWKSLEQEDFDLESLGSRLEDLNTGRIRVSRIQTSRPSPLTSDLMWLLNNEYLYADDSLASGPSTAGTGFASGDPVPEIPAQVSADYLRRRRRLVPGYLPEDEAEWRIYFEERRMLSEAEWAEIEAALSAPAKELEAAALDWSGIKVLAGELGRWVDLGGGHGQVLEAGLGAGGDPDAGDGLGNCLGAGDGLGAGNGVPSGKLWLHRSVPDEVLANLDERSELFVEWAGWQTFLGSAALELWKIPEFPDGGVDSAQGWILDKVLDSLIRLLRRSRTEQVPELSLDRLRFASAKLQGISAWWAEDTEVAAGDGTRHAEDVLSSLAGGRYSLSAIFSGLLWSRGLGIEEADRAFHEAGYVWQGRGAELAAWYPAAEEDLFAMAPDSEGDFPFPDQPISFRTFAAFERGKTSLEEIHSRFWTAVRQGAIAGDSLLSLARAQEQGWMAATAKKKAQVSSLQLPNSAQDATRPASTGVPLVGSLGARRGSAKLSRRGMAEWQVRFDTPGVWRRVSIGGGEGSFESMDTEPAAQDERNRWQIRQLFERHLVLCRSIVSDEGEPYSWSRLLPSLRRLELAGELVGGQFCPELGGLQFIRYDSIAELQKIFAEPEQPGTRVRGSFLHVQDPALYAAADPAMVRRPGRHWVFLRHLAGSSVPWFILKSGGRELEFLSAASQAVAATQASAASPLPELAVGASQALGGRGAADSAGLGIGSLESGAAGGKSPRENADEGDLRQAAELICAFFRKQVFYAQGSNRPIRMETIGGGPAADHPLAAWLVEAGFRRDGAALILWKY